jgi:hypothetical protein
VRFGVGEDLLAAFLHPFKAPTDGVHGRGHSALEHRHREPDRPPAGRVLPGGQDRLVLHEAGELVVEVEFLAIKLEVRGLNHALGEQLANLPRLGVRKRDESLLDTAEVKRGLVLPHCLLKALDVAVNVPVEE